MDEKWYIESRTDFLSAAYELIMLCGATISSSSSRSSRASLLPSLSVSSSSTTDIMAVAATARAEVEEEKATVVRDRTMIAIKAFRQFRPIILDMDSGDDEIFMDVDREKDLNSPDSNDSGIQADAQSFKLLNDDDLYGVVKKPKRKVEQSFTDDGHPVDSATEAKNNIILGSMTETAGSVERKELEIQPCCTPEVDHSDVTYAAITKWTKALKIKAEQNDEAISNNGIGNCKVTGFENADDTDDDNLAVLHPLPDGWKRHEDEIGPYYWHIKSGITQREPPLPQPSPVPTAPVRKKLQIQSIDLNGGTKTRETPKQSQDREVKYEIRTHNQLASSADGATSSAKFLVRCCGSLPLEEDDLSEERSGLAINQCISALSHRTSNLQPGKLQTHDLYLHFVGDELVLTDVDTCTVFSSQSVKSVGVWGVGRESDSRDFAYITRDPLSEKHTCWVFSCERTGHEVAAALRSVCYRILKENKICTKKIAPEAVSHLAETALNHQVYESQTTDKESQKYHAKNWNETAVFPVPMTEVKKVINCRYLGMMKVPKALGMDILNDAMLMIFSGVPRSKWVAVSLEVAPSAVTVYQRGNPNAVILECRIRFLTFLGICANNSNLGAFIMHSAQNDFFAHVFHCNPDAGLFCRTIKAACKLRYQKCLDAQAQKERESGKILSQTARLQPPFQGLKVSLQKSQQFIWRNLNKKQ